MDATQGEYPLESLHDAFWRVKARDQPDDGDGSFDLDRLNTMAHGVCSADFDDVVKAGLTRGQAPRRQSPALVIVVVDDMISAEAFQDVEFRGGRGRGDNAGTTGFGKLCDTRNGQRLA